MDGLPIVLMAAWIACFVKIRDRQFTRRVSGVRAVILYEGVAYEGESEEPRFTRRRDADAD